MRSLRRGPEPWLAALGADVDAQDVQYLSENVVPVVLHTADSHLATEAVAPLSWNCRLTSPAVIGRISVIEIAALQCEVVLWGIISTAAGEWQQRHLVDDAAPITANLAGVLPATWLPRTSRADATASFANPSAPFTLAIGDAAAVYRPAGALVPLQGTSPIPSSLAGLPREYRVCRGMGLVFTGIAANTAITLDVAGSVVPRDMVERNAAR